MNNLPKTYEISRDIAVILELLDDGTTTLEEVEDRLNLLDEQLQVKGSNVAKAVMMYQDLADGMKSREMHLAKHRRALENRAQWLRSYVQRNMELARITEIIDTRDGTEIKLVNNPPRVEIDDETKIPEEFIEVITTTKIKKADLMKVLKAKKSVPGAHLERGKRLRIT